MQSLIQKLKPLYGNKIEALYIEYLLSNDYEKKEIEQILLLLNHKLFPSEQINLIPPLPLQADGEYALGEVIYTGKPYCNFALREEEFIQHLAIFGRSGAGKTNIVFKLIENFIQHKKPFLIFDWKRNYRELLQNYDNIHIFTVGRNIIPFSFNPLIPPEGTHPIIWLKKLIEIISHAYFLGEGVIYLLTKAIDYCYREYKIYENPNLQKIKKWPTFMDVLKYLENYKTINYREANWKASSLRAISQLCFGETGRVFLIQEQIPIEKLLNKNIILELDSLSNSDKTFFIEALLLWLHHYRLQQEQREIFKHAVIIEEAHHILLRKKQEQTGHEAITDTILREIRELGEAIILIDQHPSLISIPALGNTFTTICLNLKHKDDVEMASKVLLLSEPQKEYLGRLEIGYGIIKLQGRYFNPFLVKFPEYRLKKGFISDNSIKRQTTFLKSSAYFNPELTQITSYPYSQGIKLSNNDRAFLISIHKEPFLGIVERNNVLKFSSGLGWRCKERLKNFGLIKEVDVKFKEKRIRLLELTETGKEILKKYGIKIKESKRHGGLIHEFWKEKIAQEYKAKGCKVWKEYPIGEGKSVDVVVNENGKLIVFEIETRDKHKEKNVKKCLDKFDKVVSVKC
ncbi:MAG: DUF87 domain-containing protein [Nanoarchaeota archaeon]